jgi:hypothetical protein
MIYSGKSKYLVDIYTMVFRNKVQFLGLKYQLPVSKVKI